MTKGLRICLTVRQAGKLVLLGLFASVLILGCTSRVLKEENVTLKQENERLQQENNSLQFNLNKLYQQNEDLVGRLKIVTLRRTQPDRLVGSVATTLSEQFKAEGLNIIARKGYPAVVISGIFKSGSDAATISEKGADKLKQVGATIFRLGQNYQIRVGGYTDNRPLRRRSIFKSNKGLSLVRAEAVRDFLIEQCGFSADQVTAEGFGRENPIESNETARGRAHNRRVEIVIFTD